MQQDIIGIEQGSPWTIFGRPFNFLVMPTPSHLVTHEQKQQFRDQGYCVVAGLFSEAEIAQIEAFFEDFKRNGMKVYENGMGYEETDITKHQLRAMHPHRHSDKVREWFLHPRVAAVLE